MSLINQMLRDLDRRHDTATRPLDRVLAGLAPSAAHPVIAPARQRVLGLALLGSLLCVAALRVDWHTIDRIAPADNGMRSGRVSPVVVTPADVARAEAQRRASARHEPADARADQAVADSPAPASAPASVVADPGHGRESAPAHAANAVAPVVVERPLPAPAAVSVSAAHVSTASAEHAVAPSAALPAAKVGADADGDGDVESPGMLHIQPAAPASGRDEDRTLEQAEASIAHGDTERGYAQLKQLVLAHPDAPRPRVTYARRLLAAGRRTEAEAVLRGGLARAPRDATLAGMLAHLLYDRGEAVAALHVLAAAPPPVADDPPYHAFLGALYQQQGDHLAAVRAYHAVLQATPDDGPSWIGLGISLVVLKSPAEAVAAFTRARACTGLSPQLDAYAAAAIARLQESS